jgi:hypothetical protein
MFSDEELEVLMRVTAMFTGVAIEAETCESDDMPLLTNGVS